MGRDEEHPLRSNPSPHFHIYNQAFGGKNLVPMKSGKANVFESTSKRRRQPVIRRKQPINTTTTQFQLFALLTRKHIDPLILALQDCKRRLSDLRLEDLHSRQEDESC